MLKYTVGDFIELKGSDFPEFYLIVSESDSMFRLKNVSGKWEGNFKTKTDNKTVWEEYDLHIDVEPLLDCEIQMILKDKTYHNKHKVKRVFKTDFYEQQPRIINQYEKLVIKGIKKNETDVYSFLACCVDEVV